MARPSPTSAGTAPGPARPAASGGKERAQSRKLPEPWAAGRGGSTPSRAACGLCERDACCTIVNVRMKGFETLSSNARVLRMRMPLCACAEASDPVTPPCASSPRPPSPATSTHAPAPGHPGFQDGHKREIARARAPASKSARSHVLRELCGSVDQPRAAGLAGLVPDPHRPLPLRPAPCGLCAAIALPFWYREPPPGGGWGSPRSTHRASCILAVRNVPAAARTANGGLSLSFLVRLQCAPSAAHAVCASTARTLLTAAQRRVAGAHAPLYARTYARTHACQASELGKGTLRSRSHSETSAV